jgi:alpha-tubulin suppressor-like RCC1 family protein
MITDETSGVWGLWDTYAKTNKGVYPYVGAPGLFAWGVNNNGELGQNNNTYASSPVQIPGTTWSSISVGREHSLAIKTDGTLWSWGQNSLGPVGQNNITPYSSPVQIPGTTWSSIDASTQSIFSLAIKTDGTLWSWGQNSLGQLGQNNITPYSSPVQIPGTTWSSISAGNNYALATKTDGTLWSWGRGIEGQLGQNTSGTGTYVSSPVQVPGTTWSSISAGVELSLATKTDGTLWAWGNNNYGELGQNNITRYSSPVQIPGTTWSSISANLYNAYATKTDGTLWVWGRNQYGELGQNNNTSYSSPIQIPGTTWSSISSGIRFHSLATKTDGTLWAWGYNIRGQLGQNNLTQYSSPVQIPGIGWSSVDGGDSFSMAIKIQ